jgi:hypothetical protein
VLAVPVYEKVSGVLSSIPEMFAEAVKVSVRKCHVFDDSAWLDVPVERLVLPVPAQVPVWAIMFLLVLIPT